MVYSDAEYLIQNIDDGMIIIRYIVAIFTEISSVAFVTLDVVASQIGFLFRCNVIVSKDFRGDGRSYEIQK